MDWPRVTYGCWWSGYHTYGDPINVSEWKSCDLENLAGAVIMMFTAGWFGDGKVIEQKCEKVCTKCGRITHFYRRKNAKSGQASEWKFSKN